MKKTNNNKMNKKAISELVSYVLLIVLAIAMASAAWFFLKPYAEKPLPEESCPESVNVVLENYSCDSSTNIFNFSLKNRGLFNVFGVKLNLVNESGFEKDFLWILPDCTGIQNCILCNGNNGRNNEYCLGVGESFSNSYSYSENIKTLVIYPVVVGEKNYQICTNSVVKVPIACEAGNLIGSFS